MVTKGPTKGVARTGLADAMAPVNTLVISVKPWSARRFSRRLACSVSYLERQAEERFGDRRSADSGFTGPLRAISLIVLEPSMESAYMP